MPSRRNRVASFIQSLLKKFGSAEALSKRVEPQSGPSAYRFSSRSSQNDMNQRIELLPQDGQELLADTVARERWELYSKNIEAYIGTLRMPLGLSGPLRIRGLFAQGDYIIPLATTEAALVASYTRGCRLITAAGGCSAVLAGESLQRVPVFIFKNVSHAGQFIIWAQEHFEQLKISAESTSRYAKLEDMQVTLHGSWVYLSFEFTTGDASGQNMVTIASDAACQWIIQHCPLKILKHYVESNLSGDKKATFISFHQIRGKKVNAEITIPDKTLHRYLHCSAKELHDYWEVSATGGAMSGSIGFQGHYANALAALYIACGQDAACVAESAVGITYMALTDEGDLKASVSLPNIMVGTIGGGTSLPEQKACLNILGMSNEVDARALAEIAASLCLAGELSIMGAIAAGHFTRAHQQLARGKISNEGEAHDKN